MIIIDSREPECIKSLFPNAISERKTLHMAGDFAITYNGEGKCVIERKTWADLSASIKTGRFHDQLERLKNYRTVHPCKIYILIEGKSVTTKTPRKGISFKALLCQLDRLMYKHDMYIIRTANIIGSVDRIINMHTTLTKHFEELERKMEPNLDADSASDSAQNSDEETEETNEIVDELEDKTKQAFTEMEELANSSNDEKELVKKPKMGGLDALQQVPIISDDSLLLKMWLCIPCVTDNTVRVYSSNISLQKLHNMAHEHSLKDNTSVILEWFKKAHVTTKPTYISKVLRGIKAKKYQTNIISQIKGVTKVSAATMIDQHGFDKLSYDKVKTMKWKRKLTNLEQIDLLKKIAKKE